MCLKSKIVCQWGKKLTPNFQFLLGGLRNNIKFIIIIIYLHVLCLFFFPFLNRRLI